MSGLAVHELQNSTQSPMLHLINASLVKFGSYHHISFLGILEVIFQPGPIKSCNPETVLFKRLCFIVHYMFFSFFHFLKVRQKKNPADNNVIMMTRIIIIIIIVMRQ